MTSDNGSNICLEAVLKVSSVERNVDTRHRTCLLQVLQALSVRIQMKTNDGEGCADAHG